MTNSRNRDGSKHRSRKSGNALTVIGAAVVLGVASLSAYVMSDGSTTVKPASGSAQALSLAGSGQSTQ